MKLDPAKFLSTIGVLYSQERAGREARKQQDQQREAQQFQSALQAAEFLHQTQRDQQDQPLRQMEAASRIPGFVPTPEFGAAMYERLQQPQPQLDYQGLLGSVPGGKEWDPWRNALGQAGGQPAPVPFQQGVGNLARGQAPGAAPTQPNGKTPSAMFVDPREATALKGVRSVVTTYLEQAINDGDTDSEGRLRKLLVAIDANRVTPETVESQLETLRPEMQAKTAGKVLPTRITAAAQDLSQMIQTGSVKDAHIQQASALEAALNALDTSTPAGVEAAKQVLQQYVEFKRQPVLQPGAAARQAAENAKSLDENRAQTRNAAIMQRIQTAKNPKQFLEAVRAQREMAKGQPEEYGIAPYGGDDLDDTPRMVMKRVPLVTQVRPQRSSLENAARSPGSSLLDPAPPEEVQYEERPVMETEAEAKARVLEAAAGYTENEQQARQLQASAYQQYQSLIRSEGFRRLDAPSRARIIESANVMGAKLNLPPLPTEMRSGLSPYEQQLLTKRDRDYKLQLDQFNERKRQFGENLKFRREEQARLVNNAKSTPGWSGRQNAEIALVQRQANQAKKTWDEWIKEKRERRSNVLTGENWQLWDPQAVLSNPEALSYVQENLPDQAEGLRLFQQWQAAEDALERTVTGLTAAAPTAAPEPGAEPGKPKDLRSEILGEIANLERLRKQAGKAPLTEREKNNIARGIRAGR